MQLLVKWVSVSNAQAQEGAKWEAARLSAPRANEQAAGSAVGAAGKVSSYGLPFRGLGAAVSSAPSISLI